MELPSSNEFEDWINLVDLSAIALPDDKMAECEYFLMLASSEKEANNFRWLISAFFNAAYSFFEIKALNAYQAYQHPETGEYIEDDEALEVLRRYIKVFQNAKNPSFVKTAGLHEVTEKLYELRKGNTHHYPLSVMAVGQSLPKGFQFGYLSGKGIPALEFCDEVMSLIREVNQNL